MPSLGVTLAWLCRSCRVDRSWDIIVSVSFVCKAALWYERDMHTASSCTYVCPGARQRHEWRWAQRDERNSKRGEARSVREGPVVRDLLSSQCSAQPLFRISSEHCIIVISVSARVARCEPRLAPPVLRNGQSGCSCLSDMASRTECGVSRCGSVRRGTVRRGAVRRGTAWRDIAARPACHLLCLRLGVVGKCQANRSPRPGGYHDRPARRCHGCWKASSCCRCET